MSEMANGKKRSFREINDFQYQEKPLKLVKRLYDREDDEDVKVFIIFFYFNSYSFILILF